MPQRVPVEQIPKAVYNESSMHLDIVERNDDA